MNTDLTFITNEGGQNLKGRFETLIKDTRFFDCLVGYFFTSGFFNIYKPLESTERVRVLIGINTDRRSFDLIMKTKDEPQPLKVLAALQASIPLRLLEEHIAGRTGSRTARREVILSEFLTDG
jgi:hypothetical protein